MINGVERQHGFSQDMILILVHYWLKLIGPFSLEDLGDVIMTGTPAGVGALHPNDQLTMKLLPNQENTIGIHFVQTIIMIKNKCC